MKIRVLRRGFDDYSTEIFHICRLFYEGVQLVYEPEGEAELELGLELDEPGAGEIRFRAALSDLSSGQLWSKEHTRRIGDEPEIQRKRAVKRGLGYALLQTLKEATGLEQPWGILTGVRPTKLLHNMMREHDLETCKQILRDEYLITEPKIELLTDIAVRQLKVIPDLFHLDREVSIYIGIPFCPTKCAYCTFPAYDIRGNNGSVSAFLEGLHEEIRAVGAWLKMKGLGITTLYWGGGTPTSIEAHEMDALFETLHASVPGMDRVRELTVEAGRPDTITPEKIDVMKKWKVDRISINPQSFTQQTLDTIGRHHTVAETVEKFELARRMGMNNINMDLIIGLPNEGAGEFRHTLEETARLLPESLTVHTLSFKRASRMTKNKDAYEVAERDEIGEMMEMATEFAKRHGYVPYYMYRQKNILGNLENVGYSLEGRESLYNIVMMEERQTIIGLGCGAVSKVLFPADGGDDESRRIERFPNPKEPSVYNSSYRQYIGKKLKLLDEAYPQKAGETSNIGV